jgi:hypothetical protein
MQVESRPEVELGEAELACRDPEVSVRRPAHPTILGVTAHCLPHSRTDHCAGTHVNEVLRTWGRERVGEGPYIDAGSEALPVSEDPIGLRSFSKRPIGLLEERGRQPIVRVQERYRSALGRSVA